MIILKRSLTAAGLAVGSILAIATTPAQASNFNFSTFNFNTSVSGGVGSNQMLNSVSYGNRTYQGNDLILINQVNVIQNDRWTGGNTGAASVDRGVGSSIGVIAENATNDQFLQALGNRNMNSIVDTEDKGSFTMEVSFEKAARDFLFWERGRNSRLLVEALDTAGGVVGRFLLDSGRSQQAGFNILTSEINPGNKGKAQAVGSMGLRLNQATSRLRLISRSNFNGADFKVMAAVPEPMTLMGTALAAAACLSARRRKRPQAEA